MLRRRSSLSEYVEMSLGSIEHYLSYKFNTNHCKTKCNKLRNIHEHGDYTKKHKDNENVHSEGEDDDYLDMTCGRTYI